MGKRLTLGPSGPRKEEAAAAFRRSQQGTFSRRQKLAACFVILAAASVILFLRSARHPGISQGATIPPLAEEPWPGYLKWADQLRSIYAALPDGAKQQMLSTGQYAFRLSDLAEPQAGALRETLRSPICSDVVDQWLGKPPDFSKVIFKFERAGNPKFTAFTLKVPGVSHHTVNLQCYCYGGGVHLGAPGGDEYSTGVGLWPGSQ